MRRLIDAGAVRDLFHGRVGAGVAGRDAAGQFVMGRTAAERALADLGASPAEIPAGADRAPVWPPGIVGSIAHTRDVAVAVVAPASEAASLGVDVESEGRRIVAGIERRICTPAERATFTEPSGLLALFCAKEATYKALAPLGAHRLGFHDVEYSAAGAGLLEGRIVSDAVDARVPRTFTARYAVAGGYLVAGVRIGAGRA
jgi:4'-phosphopantetheinyl transferase EntD